MDDRRFELRWRHHQSTVVAAVGSLFRDAALVDVTLACEDQRTYQAHKLVLSACSNYFQSLFTRHRTDHHPIIFLKDVTGEDCEALLAFMYRGEVSVGHDQFDRIMRVANSLQIRGLAEMAPGYNSTSRPSSPARESTDRSPTPPSPTIVPSTSCNTPTTESPVSPSTPSSQSANPPIHQDQPPQHHRKPQTPHTESSPVPSAPPRRPSREPSPHHVPSAHSSSLGALRSHQPVGQLAGPSHPPHHSAIHPPIVSHPPPPIIPTPNYPYTSPLAPHHPVLTTSASRTSYPESPIIPPSSLYGSECRKRSHPVDHDDLNPFAPHLQVKREFTSANNWDSGGGSSGGTTTDMDSNLNPDPPPPPHHRNPYLPHLLSFIGGGPPVDHHPPSEAPPPFGLQWNRMLNGLPSRSVNPSIGTDKRTFSMLDPILRGSETRHHKCQFCNRKFKRKDHLKTHIRIHTGERPYKCKICNRGFIQSQQVKIHMKVHVREDSSSLAAASGFGGTGGLGGLSGTGLVGGVGSHHTMPRLFSYTDHNNRSGPSISNESHTDLESNIPSMNLDSDNDCSSELADVEYDLRQDMTSSVDRTPPRAATKNGSASEGSVNASSNNNSSILENNSSPINNTRTGSPHSNSVNYSSNNSSALSANSKRDKNTPSSPSSPTIISSSPSPQSCLANNSSQSNRMMTNHPNANVADPRNQSLNEAYHLGAAGIKK